MAGCLSEGQEPGRPPIPVTPRPPKTDPCNKVVLVIWTLLAVGFWEPFFFCLGFLASRLVRFCSLFATTASLQVSGGNYAPGARRYNRQIKAVAYSRKSSKNSFTRAKKPSLSG